MEVSNIMGCKAEGAAQGYTVLGGIVLLIYAIQRIVAGINSPGPSDPETLIQILLSIVLIIIIALAFDACGFISWKVGKSGLLLALFGLITIVLVSYPFASFNPFNWLQSLPTLAGFMILLAGILLLARS